MSYGISVRRIGVLAAIAVVAIAGTAGVRETRDAAAQGGEAVIHAVPPAGEIKKGQDRIPIDITIDNVTNMASVQFILQYNAEIFEASETADPAAEPVIQKGEFLGSTGRQVVCNEPQIEPGAIRLTCVSLGTTPPGPDGSGKLATVYLRATGSGQTTLTLDRVKANYVGQDAGEIPIAVENAPVSVKGNSGGIAPWVWVLIVVGGLAVGAAAVGAVLVLRSRGGGARPATAL